MYIYFNNEGQLTTIIQHGDPVIRQGSNFNLYVLFESDCPYIVGSGNDEEYPSITIKFKKDGENFFGDEKPLSLYNREYNFTRLNSSELTFDLDDKAYICYKYEGTSYDSSKYGNLYGVITVYAPLENVVLTDNTIVGDAVPRSVITTGLLTTYIERTTGTATVPSVNSEQYNYLMTLIGMVWNRILGGDGSINIGILRGNSQQKRVDVDSDLIPYVDATYKIGDISKRWTELHLSNKFDYNSTNLKINANGDYFSLKYGNDFLLETKLVGSSYVMWLNGEDITSKVADLHTKIYGNNSTTGVIPLVFGSLANYLSYNKAPFETRVGRLENAVGDVANYPNSKGTLMNRMNIAEGNIDILEGRADTLEGQRPGFIELFSSTGTLTASQILELAQPDCVIKYGNKYYFRDFSTSDSGIRFTRIEYINAQENDNKKIVRQGVINLSSLTYEYSVTQNVLDLLSPDNVVNNLTTNHDKKPLSATQGRLLKGYIDDINEDIGAYTDNDSAGTIKGKITKNKTDIADIYEQIGSDSDNGVTIKGRLKSLENSDFQSQIDGINAGQNLVDIVATKSALNSYVTTNLHIGDKVQVLADESIDVTNPPSTVYNWNGSSWDYIGPYGQDSYMKSEVYTKQETEGVVDVERTRILALETEVGAQSSPNASSLRGRMDSAEARLTALESFDSGLTAITNAEIEGLFS